MNGICLYISDDINEQKVVKEKCTVKIKPPFILFINGDTCIVPEPDICVRMVYT